MRRRHELSDAQRKVIHAHLESLNYRSSGNSEGFFEFVKKNLKNPAELMSGIVKRVGDILYDALLKLLVWVVRQAYRLYMALVSPIMALGGFVGEVMQSHIKQLVCMSKWIHYDETSPNLTDLTIRRLTLELIKTKNIAGEAADLLLKREDVGKYEMDEHGSPSKLETDKRVDIFMIPLTDDDEFYEGSSFEIEGRTYVLSNDGNDDRQPGGAVSKESIRSAMSDRMNGLGSTSENFRYSVCLEVAAKVTPGLVPAPFNLFTQEIETGLTLYIASFIEMNMQLLHALSPPYGKALYTGLTGSDSADAGKQLEGAAKFAVSRIKHSFNELLFQSIDKDKLKKLLDMAETPGLFSAGPLFPLLTVEKSDKSEPAKKLLQEGKDLALAYPHLPDKKGEKLTAMQKYICDAKGQTKQKTLKRIAKQLVSELLAHADPNEVTPTIKERLHDALDNSCKL